MKLNRLIKRGSFLALFLCLISLGSVFGQNLTITTTVCTSATEVRLTGPWWGWNPTGGPAAVNNGNGTWTFTFSPAPTDNMEYLLVVDGVQENLISAMANGGTCAPITDYANYANRQWLLTDPLNITNTYGQCGTCGGSSLTQMNLPVTFEGTTVEYGVIGFEGAEASTIEIDPTNSANTVVKVIKSATAQPWAGTTITAAAALGLSTPIPFTASNQTMTLKVWSPDAGITVRLKVEEHGNNTHTVETDAVTTVAGQWETLTFNFANQASGTAAINLAYTYDKASVFFNFGVNGATAGVKTYYFDDFMMGTGGGGTGLAQMTLPVTFEGTTVEYGVIGFEGAEASTIEVDPTNSANTVVKVIKSATAQPWAGTTITAAAALGLATPIPFTASNQTMTLKVWSPDAGIQVRLKVEEHGNNTHTVETEATTTTAGQWETLTFNFANQASGTAAINLAYTYDKASVFFNFGVNGATAGVKTYYFDDFMMGTGGGGTGLAQMTLPVTFEGTTVDYGVIGFEGAEASTIEVDPTNSANTVVKVIKSATAQPWAGTTITAAAALGLASPIPFTASNKKMTLKVWSPDAGIQVRLKVEEHGNNTHTVETEATTTSAGQWETLTFDFANQASGTAAINLAYTYDKASVFFNFGVNGATAGVKTYYFDDLNLYTATPTPVTITYQVDVTDYISGGATLNTAGIRVGGNFSTVGATLPDWTPSNAACAMTDLGSGLWSIAVTYPASAIGTTQSYKFVNGDWGTNEGGSASLIAIDGCGTNDGGGNINRTLVIPATNTTYTFCWDKCTACGVVTLAQMTLPVTFQGTTVDYGVIGFEGAEASTIEADPTNANNTVVKVIKSATAQPWAGTTITAAAALGLANPVPFTASNKKMTLKVWSPDAGIQVRLKLEEHGNNTHTVETEATTTVAGQWETLTFDFANQATGTAAINLSYTYDKPSVFFNFGVNGATAGAKTYYFDDLKMYAMPVTGLQITVDVCSIAANEVRMTGPFWSWDPTAGPFAVNNNDGTWTFTLDPIPTTDMEYLIIVNGVQENLISDMQNGGTCAPVTDYFSYANRKWVVGSGNVNISYDRCVPCSYPDIVITTEVCSAATQVKLTGPIWQWNPNFGPTAVNNGNGTYTFTISPAPNDTLEYLLVKDGVVENLVQEMVNGGGCAPITDYSTYANRRWLLGQGAVANTYGRCSPCSVGIGELTDNDLVVYPNPTNGTVNVTSEFTIEKIEVYSMIGELVNTKNATSNEVNVELQNLASGVYTLNVFANGGMKTVRIIKN